MSHKRSAEDDMTSENYFLFESNDDSAPVGQSKASAEVIAKRKILKPRSRLAGRTAGSIPKPTPSSSSFGFNFQPAPSLGSSQANDDDSTTKPNPFAAFNSPSSTENNNKNEDEPKPNPFAAFAPPKTNTETSLTASKPAFSFGQSSGSSFSSSSALVSNNKDTSLSSSKDSEKASKIKALNDNFYTKITQAKNSDPLSDFTPILRKYLEYIEQINDNEPVKETQQVQQIEDSPVEPTFKALPATGFNFGSTASSGFSFGTDNNSSTSTKTTSSTPAFSFGSTKSDTAPISAPTPVPAVQIEEKKESPEVISIDEDEDDSSDDDIKVEGPQFTLEKPPTTTDSVFKLTADATKTSGSTSSGPSFTFAGGDKKFDNPFKFTKPVEQKERTETNDDKKDEQPPKPAFSFGSIATQEKKEETSTPASSGFSFSLPTKPSTDSTTTTAAAPTSGLSFNFSTTKPTNGETTTSISNGFSFGSTTNNSTPAEETTEKPKFSFNFGNPTKPAFGGFSSTSTDQTSSENKPATPSFVFGGNSANAAPSFGQASTFNFNIPKPATTTNSDSNNNNNNNEDDKPDEEEPNVQFTAVAKLADQKVEEKTGEEDEELLYTKRSKIQRFSKDSNSYESKGLGDLKVLLNKGTKKARILVRADGSNRVILNVPILSDFKYEKMGPKGNMVKIPVIEEGKIETYLSQVKTGEDGTNLFNALEEAKNGL